MDKKIYYVIILVFSILFFLQISPGSSLASLATNIEQDNLVSEDMVGKDLLFYGLFIVPFTIAIITAVITHTVDIAAGSINREQLKKLIIPAQGQNIFESFSNIFSTPEIWILLMVGVFFIVANLFHEQSLLYGEMRVAGLFLVAGPVALLVPVLISFFIWYAAEKKLCLRLIISCFMWGSFAAVLTVLFNMYAASLGGASQQVLTVVWSPVVEEIFKGICLLVLFFHRDFKNPVTGFFLALSVGFGFSALENIIYFLARVSPYTYGLVYWAGLIAYRSLFNTLAHGLFISSLGIALGYAKSRGEKPVAMIAIGYLFAIILHSLFNISAIVDYMVIERFNLQVNLFNPLTVMVMAGVLILGVMKLSEGIENKGAKNGLNRKPGKKAKA